MYMCCFVSRQNKNGLREGGGDERERDTREWWWVGEKGMAEGGEGKRGLYKIVHFPLVALVLLPGKTTDLMASSKTCLSPFCVSAEHSM